MSNLKTNFAYNLILTLSGYLFTLITFPYVSRILGVDNIGSVNFVDSIINYFVLFSMMGVGSVGIREVAKYKDSKDDLQGSFRDIFLLNFLFTVIAILVLVCLIFFVPKFQTHSHLLFIGIIKLMFNFCLIEWFFTGIENFKFITIRSTIIKLIYVVSVLILVKDRNDFEIYYFLTCLVVVINAVLNWSYLVRIIKFRVKGFNYRRYIKSITVIGSYMILTSMYVHFNVTYLGFVSGEKEVGYYTTATKLYALLLSVFTAFTGVMLPRMTALLTDGKIEEFQNNITKSFNFLILFSFPIIVFTTVFAYDIVLLLAGKEYLGAVLPMQIVMPLLMIIGIEQILVIQILMPLKKDKTIMWNSLFGGALGVLLNIVLVHFFKSVGSAVVWLCCELVILALSLFYAKKSIEFSFPYKELLKQIVFTLPIIAVTFYFSKHFAMSSVLKLIGGFTIIYIYYFILWFLILKNPLLINYIKKW
ncbi:flippase [Chryseobacterium sp. RLHN22]|uniref:flippase n=1 Tax=Chryseobacterium sp. RLHN22 TaxID=3437885 RepID=UPI003D9B8296